MTLHVGRVTSHVGHVMSHVGHVTAHVGHVTLHVGRDVVCWSCDITDIVTNDTHINNPTIVIMS